MILSESQQPCVAIIAGGLATRLGSIATHTPKLLLEVAGKPFFENQLELLQAAGLTRIVLCTGHLGDVIQKRYRDGSNFGVSISYSFDGQALLGTGGALRKALPFLGSVCYVLYGDSYLPMDYQAAYEAYKASGKSALMTIYANEGRYDRSNVHAETGRIISYDKNHPTSRMKHIDYGLSIFSAEAIMRMPANSPYDLADLQHMLAEEGQLAAFEVQERFYEIGTPAGITELETYLSSKTTNKR